MHRVSALVVSWLVTVLALPLPAFALNHAEALFQATEKGHYDQAIRHAAKLNEPLLQHYSYWAALTDTGAPTLTQVSFKHFMNILEATKEWPLHNRVRLKVEEAAFRLKPLKREMRDFCKDFPPISGYGMFACVQAGVVDKKNRAFYISQGWKQGDFTKDDEKTILKNFRKALNYSDHYARIDRLLFEGKHKAAKRILPQMKAEDQAVFLARIALRSTAPDAERRLSKLSSARKIDPGVMFDRMQWRHKKGKNDGVIDMLVQAPKNPPYPDLWWPFRARYAREALEKGRIQDALSIIANAGKLENANQAEALWMLGWITLEHKKDAKAAYEFFYALYQNVSYPVSKARAAFWAGEAARRNSNLNIAKEWYQKAAHFPMVFYGQIAHAMLYQSTPLDLKENLHPQPLSASEIKRDDMFKLLSLFAIHKQDELLDQFLLHAVDTSHSQKRMAALIGLAQQIGKRHHQVRAAKYALRQQVFIPDAGWPLMTLPKNLALEQAFTLAITRQESEFDPKARSSADARGLMQLLPRTARDVARQLRLSFHPNHLWKPEYNIQVGSAYLKRLIEAYDGNPVLAVAAYNAGIGNVRKWLKQYGTPGKNLSQTLLWIESIPFSETRNYVQRVLENLQTYRARLNPKAPNKILLDLNA